VSEAAAESAKALRYVVMTTRDVPPGAAACCHMDRDYCDQIARAFNAGGGPTRTFFQPYQRGQSVYRDRECWAVVDTETIAAPELLTGAVRELLANLAEEAAEVVQRCTKILRFGLRRNPYSGELNARALERDLGDLHALEALLVRARVIDPARVGEAQADKLRALDRNEAGRLRYAGGGS
jgi:hypothetical protein